jgi:hypothetical protein
MKCQAAQGIPTDDLPKKFNRKISLSIERLMFASLQPKRNKVLSLVAVVAYLLASKRVYEGRN